MSAVKKLIIGAIAIMISLALVPCLNTGALRSNPYRKICQIRGMLKRGIVKRIAELTYQVTVENVERLDGRYPQSRVMV